MNDKYLENIFLQVHFPYQHILNQHKKDLDFSKFTDKKGFESFCTQIANFLIHKKLFNSFEKTYFYFTV